MPGWDTLAVESRPRRSVEKVPRLVSLSLHERGSGQRIRAGGLRHDSELGNGVVTCDQLPGGQVFRDAAEGSLHEPGETHRQLSFAELGDRIREDLSHDETAALVRRDLEEIEHLAARGLRSRREARRRQARDQTDGEDTHGTSPHHPSHPVDYSRWSSRACAWGTGERSAAREERRPRVDAETC